MGLRRSGGYAPQPANRIGKPSGRAEQRRMQESVGRAPLCRIARADWRVCCSALWSVLSVCGVVVELVVRLGVCGVALEVLRHGDYWIRWTSLVRR